MRVAGAHGQTNPPLLIIDRNLLHAVVELHRVTIWSSDPQGVPLARFYPGRHVADRDTQFTMERLKAVQFLFGVHPEGEVVEPRHLSLDQSEAPQVKFLDAP
jgi:hypothetical protein